jgi:hypothetical protein
MPLPPLKPDSPGSIERGVDGYLYIANSAMKWMRTTRRVDELLIPPTHRSVVNVVRFA